MSEEPLSAPELYPWLSASWTNLVQAHTQRRLPHALLVSGLAGIGKWDFARALGWSLLCQSPLEDGRYCGQCHQCHLSAAGSQPDLLCVEPEEAGKGIRIDQIRGLCAELALKSHGGGYKVALICPAERMNVAAANSLLKTLEEPTDNTLLVLVTERPAQLPATIRSRCQQLQLPAPGPADALAWLTANSGVDANLAGLLLDLVAGAPLAALKLADTDVITVRKERLEQLEAIQGGHADPLAVSAQWSKEADLEILVWMQGWISDMIRVSVGGESTHLRNADLRQPLARMAGLCSTTTLYTRLDQVINALRMGAAGSINRQLMIEDILVSWVQGAES